MGISIVPITPVAGSDNPEYPISVDEANDGFQKLTQTSAGVLGLDAAGDTVVIPAGSGITIGGSPLAISASGVAGSGDVVGPAASVDSEIALFDSTTGKLLKRASGSGLVLGASGVASFVDYTAPTTFTPTITFGGGATGVTYSVQSGRYMKIANRIFFDLSVVLTAKGSSTGAAQIEGLPVAMVNTSNTSVACACQLNNLTSISGHLLAFIAPGSTVVSLSFLGTGTATGMTQAHFTDTSVARVSGHYPIS